MLKKVKNKISQYKIYILGIFCLGLVWDIFFSPQISDLGVLILGLLWILTIFSFKFEPQTSFILAAFSYAVSFIFQFLGKEMIMEKGVSWFFVFLTIALVQKLIQEFTRKHEVKT